MNVNGLLIGWGVVATLAAAWLAYRVAWWRRRSMEASDGWGEALRALNATHRELLWLRPGLDRPHSHRGVMREKVDGALQLAERTLARTTKGESNAG